MLTSQNSVAYLLLNINIHFFTYKYLIAQQFLT